MKRREFIVGVGGLVGSAIASRSRADSMPCPPGELRIGADVPVRTSCRSTDGMPKWVPALVGQAALVPTGNRLEDVFIQAGTQNPTQMGSQKLCDFSGGVYNRYYKEFGAHVVHGGGHSATNDNSVFLLDYNSDSPMFRRVAGPTQLASADLYDANVVGGGFPDNYENPRELTAGVPGSAHTYDKLLILPPALCGDPLGALIRPVASAVGIRASRSTGWSHLLSLTSGEWSRWSLNASPIAVDGGSTVLDSSRGRIWPVTHGDVRHLSYLDCKTRTWSNVAGNTESVVGYADMVYSAFHVSSDIVVLATNRDADSAMRFYWFAAGSNGQARNAVVFSKGDLPTASWGQGSLVYIEEIGKFIYYTQTDMDAYFEIEVPSDPKQAWSFTRVSITGMLPSKLPTTPANSTYKRMDYSSRLKSLLWVTGAANKNFHFGGQALAIRVAA